MSLLRRLLMTNPVLDFGGNCYRKSHEVDDALADYQMRARVYYDELDITAVGITRYGTVIQPTPLGTDSLGTGTGAIIEKDGTLYHIYGGYNALTPAGPAEWKPHLATSTDGITWAKQGIIFEPPAGYNLAYPGYIFLEGDYYYLFFHVKLIGHGPVSPNGWFIWYATCPITSTDLTDWTIQGHVVDNNDVGIALAITNPSVINVGDYYYMVVSQKIGAGVFYINLLRSSSLTSGYSDLGIIIDPTAPQFAWYNVGAWDATIFVYDGQYVMVFGASDGVQQYYAFAYTTNIEGVWTVIDPPFITHAAGIGGRSTVYFEDDDPRFLRIYCDFRIAAEVRIDLLYDILETDMVRLNGNCRTDFADVRFRQGATELDYWIKESVIGSYAIIFFKMSGIPSDPLYIYYGRAGITTTTSSIYDTFIVGDDFEECDLARWTDESVLPGIATCASDQEFEGDYSFRGEDGVAAGGLARIAQTFTARNTVRVWGAFRVPTPPGGENVTALIVLYSNGVIRLRWGNWDGTLRYYDGGAWQNVYVGAVNTWYQYLLIYKQTDAITWNFDLYFYDAAGNLVGSVTDIAAMDSTGSVNKLVLQISYTTGGAGYAWQDIIRIGEYGEHFDPEPAHGEWGTEEAAVWPF